MQNDALSKIHEAVRGLPIPKKRIKTMGRSIIVTCASRSSAQQWVVTLRRFCSRVEWVESVDEVERKTCLVSRCQRVYRVWGQI